MSWPARPIRKSLGPVLAVIAAAVLLALGGPSLLAQSRGSAEIATQGYYQGGYSSRIEDITGSGFKFRDFIPRVGLLSGSFEGYGHQGSLEVGDNFLQLRGASWLGRRWTLTAGDFRTMPSQMELPFNNLYYPEISARGIRIEAARTDSRYSVYLGQETLLSGPRVPFRIKAPQSLLGLSAQRTIRKRLQVGVQFMHLWSSEKSIEDNPYYFLPQRAYRSANNVAIQSLYVLPKGLRLYGETNLSAAKKVGAPGKTSVPVSLLGAVSWETTTVTARANYAYLGPSYLPLVGFFAGDRRGPFAELRYRPSKGFEVFGSANRYTNNLDHNPVVRTYRTQGESLGASVMLPLKLNASAQLSTLRLSTTSPETGTPQDSNNRMLTLTLTRSIRRHSLRLTGRDLRLTWPGRIDRQRSAEVEDYFSYKRFTLSAGVRGQAAIGQQRKNTLFARGSVQAHFRRFTAYGFFESGKDLVNQTVFATDTIKTTTFGMTASLSKTWSLSMDLFRYGLVTELNPESIFVLGGRGVGVSTALTALNRWNLYVRLAKQFSWGGSAPEDNLMQYSTQEIPLVGAVEGFVYARMMEGPQTAAGIPVSLDASRSVQTDATGRFRFSEVPEGSHKVTVVTRELPADYDPGPVPEATVVVQPRRVARAELDVLPLTMIQGRVVGFSGVPAENILIKLLPTDRYTTTGSDGNFSFQNLREGDYELLLDEQTLPEHSRLKSPNRVPCATRLGRSLPAIQFEFEVRQPEKPVRKVLEKGL